MTHPCLRAKETDDVTNFRECPRTFEIRADCSVVVTYRCGAEVRFSRERVAGRVDVATLEGLSHAHAHHWPHHRRLETA